MKPVLFDMNAVAFDTQGIGSLFDCVSCKVTEERNGPYTLEMEYPITGIRYKDIQISSIIVAKPCVGGSRQPFRIVKISRPINGIVTIEAQHISYALVHIPVAPFSCDGLAAACAGIKANAVEKHTTFDISADFSGTGKFSVVEPKSARACIGGSEGSIIDTYGGEIEWNGFAAIVHRSRGRDNGVAIRYGKNLTGIKAESSVVNVVTGIYGFWKGEDGKVVCMDEPVYSSLVGLYPYNRTVVQDFSADFTEEPSILQLKLAAESYIERNGLGELSSNITCEFVDSGSGLDKVNLCDIVQVHFEKMNISVEAKVIKTVYDVLRDRYDKVELGKYKNTMSGKLTEAKSNAAADTATETSRREQAMNAISSESEKLAELNFASVNEFFEDTMQPYESDLMPGTKRVSMSDGTWCFTDALPEGSKPTTYNVPLSGYFRNPFNIGSSIQVSFGFMLKKDVTTSTARIEAHMDFFDRKEDGSYIKVGAGDTIGQLSTNYSDGNWLFGKLNIAFTNLKDYSVVDGNVYYPKYARLYLHVQSSHVRLYLKHVRAISLQGISLQPWGLRNFIEIINQVGDVNEGSAALRYSMALDMYNRLVLSKGDGYGDGEIVAKDLSVLIDDTNRASVVEHMKNSVSKTYVDGLVDDANEYAEQLTDGAKNYTDQQISMVASAGMPKQRPFGSNDGSGSFLVATCTLPAQYEDAVLMLMINSGYASVDFSGILHVHVRSNASSPSINVATVDWLSYTGDSIPTMTVVYTGLTAYLYITTNYQWQIYNVQVLTNHNMGVDATPWIVSDGSSTRVSMMPGAIAESKAVTDITIADGITAGGQVGATGNKCYRVGRMCTLYINVRLPAGTTNYTTLGSIPDGFRPKTGWVTGVAWCQYGAGMCIVGLTSGGSISLITAPPSGEGDIVVSFTYMV